MARRSFSDIVVPSLDFGPSLRRDDGLRLAELDETFDAAFGAKPDCFQPPKGASTAGSLWRKQNMAC